MDTTVTALVVGGILLVVLSLGLLIFFWKSLPGVLTVLTAASQDKDDIVDPDAEIYPLQERHSSEVLKDRAVQVKEDLLPPVQTMPQQIPLQPMPQQPVPQAMPQQILPPMVEPAPLPVNTMPQVEPPPMMPNNYTPPIEPAPIMPNPQVPPVTGPVPTMPATPVPPVTGPAPMMPNSNLPLAPAPTSNPSMQTEIYQAPQELVQRPAILDSDTPIVQTPAAPIQGEVPEDVAHLMDQDDNSKYAVRDSSLPPGRIIRDGRYNRNSGGD